MATNYEKLKQANIEEYGKGTVHLSYLGMLYSDRTHFVFELLQNAEDAGASNVRFNLYADRLEFRHNGRPFDSGDVKGICSVGQSVKKEDLTLIGKFGIGFKSVYAYTTRPEVHSNDEHFAIEHFVRPKAVAPRKTDGEETLFVFPFDHPEVSSSQAYREIEARLNSLTHVTLLFLRNLKELVWVSHNSNSKAGLLVRNQLDYNGLKLVSVSEKASGFSTEWLIFERPVTTESSDVPLRVEIAFATRRNQDGILEIQAFPRSQLVVFFPTEKETHVGFLIQGPYRTTPARDNIPQHNEFNQLLMVETAALIEDALRSLRDAKMLTVEVLDLLPIWAMDFPMESMFYPLFEGIRESFRNEKLLPCQDGTFADASSCRIARGGPLRELLSDHQLSELFGGSCPVKWLSPEITADRKPRLSTFLRAAMGVREIDVPDLAAGITDQFLCNQSDEWLQKLYLFLDQHRQVTRKQSPTFLSKEFIRLADGSMVRPFDSQGRANAFLPAEGCQGFPTIKKSLVEDRRIELFFVGLGLEEPDVYAYIEKTILPLYEGSTGEISFADHLEHLKQIIGAVSQGPHEKRSSLKAVLKLTRFLLAKNMAQGTRTFQYPGALYLPSEAMNQYAEGNPNVWMIDESESVLELMDEAGWESLGVEKFPRRKSVVSSLSQSEKQHLRNGEKLTRELDGKDYDLDGLTFALDALAGKSQKQAVQSGCSLWNMLHRYTETLTSAERESYFLGEYRWYNGKAKSKLHPAQFVRKLRQSKWLPNKEGVLCVPTSLTVEDLSDDCIPSDLLTQQLGLVGARLTELAKELGVDPDLLKFLRTYPDEVEQLKLQFLSRRRKSKQESSTFASELVSALSTPQKATQTDAEPSSGIVEDSEFRRQRVSEEIAESKSRTDNESDELGVIIRRASKAKDPQTREFLLQQYSGKCQVCSFTFVKANGEPYFEAVYLMSRLSSEWIDRPGNVLCLCANCSAMFTHGARSHDDIETQILAYRMRSDGGQTAPVVKLSVCSNVVELKFTEKHILDLQELMKFDSQSVRSE